MQSEKDIREMKALYVEAAINGGSEYEKGASDALAWVMGDNKALDVPEIGEDVDDDFDDIMDDEEEEDEDGDEEEEDELEEDEW